MLGLQEGNFWDENHTCLQNTFKSMPQEDLVPLEPTYGGSQSKDVNSKVQFPGTGSSGEVPQAGWKKKKSENRRESV